MDGPCKSAYVFTMIFAPYSFVLFLNSIYFVFVMQQYNLDMLFTILLISSKQVSFGKMVYTKQSSPWSTTRACWSSFSRLPLCSDHVWAVRLHWSFCSTKNCLPPPFPYHSNGNAMNESKDLLAHSIFQIKFLLVVEWFVLFVWSCIWAQFHFIVLQSSCCSQCKKQMENSTTFFWII
jgi:hypothetical protein